nr:hypothetical protein [uncultured Psychroserpens sp.]
MKKVFLVVTVLFTIFAAFYGAIHLFGRYIYNTQSCELFNIDNIELRTGVNIPEITSSDCDCHNNHKEAKFIINKQEVDLENYVSKNNFRLVHDLYVKENDNENSTYRVTLNKQTAELIINLTYKSN